METITFEGLPIAVSNIANRIEGIETLLSKERLSQNSPLVKYDLKEAAKYCGMAAPTFRTYLYDRKVAGTKFGKAWLFLEKDLDQFIADYRRPTVKELEKEAVDNLTGGGR